MREHRQARVAFVIVAAAAWALILWLGLGLTFFADEWAFIEHRALTDPGTWWLPHNEHWATLPVLVYRVLVETVGIGSYVPYLILVTGLHVAVAGLVFRLIERSSGPLLAPGRAAIILVFGSGFENLYVTDARDPDRRTGPPFGDLAPRDRGRLRAPWSFVASDPM